MILAEQIIFDRELSQRHIAVLVVDSNPYRRDELVEGIRRQGWRCLAAGTAERACEYVRRGRVDICIVDPVMRDERGVSGMALLALMRVQWPLVPVFCLTGRPHLASRDACLQCGAADYDVRPTGSIPHFSGRFMRLIRGERGDVRRGEWNRGTIAVEDRGAQAGR